MKVYGLVIFLTAGIVPVSAQFATFNANSSQKTYPSSINASGVVTGHYFDGYNVGHGFVRDAQGNITSFDASSAALTSTFPYSINASGAVAGTIATGPNGTIPYSAFLRDAQGTITPFEVPNIGNGGTFAGSINDSGSIAGSFISENDGPYGFVRDAQGNFHVFDVSDFAGTTSPYAINASGAVAGSYTGQGPGYGSFVRDPQGNITTFDPGGGTDSNAASINASGAIAGTFTDKSNVKHGYVRDSQGNITSFDPAGSTGTTATGINTSGAITGWYLDASGVQHGFVRDPQGNITSFDPAAYATGTTPNGINDSGAITGQYSSGLAVGDGFIGRAPNTMDISSNISPIPKSLWPNAKQAGVSNLIVVAWEGSTHGVLAESQLLEAQSNGLGTAAYIRLNYFEKDSAAYQVGRAIAAIGTGISKLKFIALDIQTCCGEFISWKPSTSYANNSLIMDPASHIQKVITAGTSGATAPAWNDAGATTSDGTVVWQDTGAVVIDQAARIARISAAVTAIQAYNLPHGVVIFTDGPNGGWQKITGNCGTGTSNNCSSLIDLPLWSAEHKTFAGADGLEHCGDGIAGLYGFTPYSSTTWQARSGNQYDFGLYGPASTCKGETNVFGNYPAVKIHLDYFDPTLFQ
jgi:hypothetical protein